MRFLSHYTIQKNKMTPKRVSFCLWRRTWDSNPRGCYTLLDFQSSSLATRSILQVCAAQRHLYYYSISGPALQAKFRQSCIFSFRKATFFFTVFCSLLFQAFRSVFTLYERTTHCLKPMGFLLRRPRNLLSPQALIRTVPALYCYFYAICLNPSSSIFFAALISLS